MRAAPIITPRHLGTTDTTAQYLIGLAIYSQEEGARKKGAALAPPTTGSSKQATPRSAASCYHRALFHMAQHVLHMLLLYKISDPGVW